MNRVFLMRDPLRRNAETGAWERMIDLAPAREYGELVFLLPPGRTPVATPGLVRVLRERLAGFSDDDYLLPIGDPLLIALAAALAADANDGRLRLLTWDKHERRYLVSEADVREPEVVT